MTHQFHKETEHSEPFALLFDSHKIEEKFKERAKDYPYTVIKDKEEARLFGMLMSVGELGAKFYQLQMSAINAVAIASSIEETLLIASGLVKIIPGGVDICPSCLERAILTCEENLEVLKDIREAVSKYATTKP